MASCATRADVGRRKQKMVTVSIEPFPGDMDRLKAIAKEKGISCQALINEIFSQYLAEKLVAKPELRV